MTTGSIRLLARHFGAPVLNWRSPFYEQRFIESMNRNSLKRFATPREFFSGTSDQYLLWLLLNGNNFGYDLNGLIPELPTEAMQRNWTGRSGEAALREAFWFFKIIKQSVAEFSVSSLSENIRILDFGCGWGRIIRLFLRDVAHENLHACDCYPEALNVAAQQNKWSRFKLIDPSPPTPYAASQFDLIYLFSVFSHLSEPAHLELIREFHRLLKPGGLLIATTRHRRFILYCERLRRHANRVAHAQGSAASFPDTVETLARYDRGELVHSPSGGGGVLSSSFYGETCIPKMYVERNWRPYFELLRYRTADMKCDQNVIVCRKSE